MARINLLPWREQERARRNREFVMQLVVVALLSLLAAFAAWTFFNAQLESQQEANAVVKQANEALDRDLEQIKELEKTREDIVSRMKVIQDLQGTRPIPVHVFDNLVRVMPANVFLNRISLRGDVLTLEGRADNPNSVSDLLRNIDLTKWLDHSAVKRIENVAPAAPASQRNADGKVIVIETPPPEAEYIKFVMTTKVVQTELDKAKEADKVAASSNPSQENAQQGA